MYAIWQRSNLCTRVKKSRKWRNKSWKVETGLRTFLYKMGINPYPHNNIIKTWLIEVAIVKACQCLQCICGYGRAGGAQTLCPTCWPEGPTPGWHYAKRFGTPPAGKCHTNSFSIFTMLQIACGEINGRFCNYRLHFCWSEDLEKHSIIQQECALQQQHIQNVKTA